MTILAALILTTNSPVPSEQQGYPIFLSIDENRCTYGIQDMIGLRKKNVRDWMKGLPNKERQIDLVLKDGKTEPCVRSIRKVVQSVGFQNIRAVSYANWAIAINTDTTANNIGDYLCTVAEKALIESRHLEGSAPPKAFIDNRLPTRFKIRIDLDKKANSEFRLIELPYNEADRDQMEWHTENSILHSPYVGNGESFSAKDKDAEAFFVFGETVHASDDGKYGFYHAGFEWPGGEDTNLSVRWGRCRQI